MGKGRPEVTEKGDIVYVFDDLQSTARQQRGKPPPHILQEKPIPFSLADRGQLALAGCLGVVNVLGVAYLGLRLSALPPDISLPGVLGIVKGLYPALVAYAVSFLLIPAIRCLRLKRKNAMIAMRNANRTRWLRHLQSGEVDGKLADAK